MRTGRFDAPFDIKRERGKKNFAIQIKFGGSFSCLSAASQELISRITVIVRGSSHN